MVDNLVAIDGTKEITAKDISDYEDVSFSRARGRALRPINHIPMTKELFARINSITGFVGTHQPCDLNIYHGRVLHLPTVNCDDIE